MKLIRDICLASSETGQSKLENTICFTLPFYDEQRNREYRGLRPLAKLQASPFDRAARRRERCQSARCERNACCIARVTFGNGKRFERLRLDENLTYERGTKAILVISHETCLCSLHTLLSWHESTCLITTRGSTRDILQRCRNADARNECRISLA